jgi:cyclomaltodextrinase
MAVPYWVQDSIFYQIFPDRFANGDPDNDPPNIKPWGSPPTPYEFQGGDLRGIIQNFDYLLDLGINALYLNPIFQSPSNHRYNTYDYYRIDPFLGDQRDFQALLEVAHQNGVRVILDGVFNHCSRGFFAFNNILENRENSPYADWFHIKRYPPDAYSPGKAEDYLAWWDYKPMPKFNTQNPRVRQYIFGVAKYWINLGADGWRLDVPNEIDDDPFWDEFRRAVHSANREAYLIGEIWNVDPRWVGEGHFDGLMNYPLREAILAFLQKSELTASQFADRVERLLTVYPRENVYAMYSLLGSHDTERLLTALEEDISKVKLAFLFQFAYPGAPAVYYGDEIGLTGGKDPGCRGAFPWEPGSWKGEIRSWVQCLASQRKRLSALRRGNYLRIFADDRKRCYAFARTLGDEKILVVMNASPSKHTLILPVASLEWEDGRILHNLLGSEDTIVSEDQVTVTLPSWSGGWYM